MSNQPFSFPPPPPPPPKRTTDSTYQPHQNQGYQNGRGSFRGGHGYRATSRGGRGGRGDRRGGGQGNSMNHGQNWSNPSRPSHNGPPRGGQFQGHQKRDYNTAFVPTQQQQQQHRPRPTAPPAVPNFNAPIQHLLARQPSTGQPNQKPSDPQKPGQKKQNLLGLTPAKFERDSDPEDDEDEEQRLADQTASVSSGYVFEYNGNPLLLRSREEILAWIAERKRRYPTEAKREAARKEAELKKRKREEEYQARLEARKEAQMKREQERAERQKAKEQERAKRQKVKEPVNKRRVKDEAPVDETSRAMLKAEKLRKRAFKAQQDLEKAEEALQLAQSKKDGEALPVPSDDIASQDPSLQPLDPLPTPVAALGEDETSSSGSSTTDSDSDFDTDSDNTSPDLDSDSDADSAPEVTSTKQQHHTRDTLALASDAQRAKAKAPRLCQHLVKYKTCKYGSNCRYSHDLSQKGRRAAAGMQDRAKSGGVLPSKVSEPIRRKGLWEVMVEKEQEEERKRVLEAIIVLGQRGLLDDPSQGVGPEPKSMPEQGDSM
ncbi:hypothetical protein A1O7_07142 [Cladophialophora yegresii CBS 114405]|uniref:C3H1-type domain-containing protein n=1 Tax=Cladophialophora yegresii CBS 114405 TaxID=1182544 RepID=W9VMN9_9EURO|nr:uncharacterized protein A1O7_07142 [Cladophialophora yegresii CBS 114405]EXJ56798.1 hypothetical protein A1O7_07142 [Cladophialophora yegresii CBS 114405]